MCLGTFMSQFRVFDFLHPLIAHLGQPAFEGLGPGGWDGLDDAEKRLRIGTIGISLFAVNR